MSNENGNGKPKNQKSKPLKIVIIVLVVLLAVLGMVSLLGFMSYNKYLQILGVVDTDTIYDGIYINDVDVGGMTQDEANSALQDEYDPKLESESIEITDGDNVDDIKYSDIDGHYAFDDAIAEAMQYAKDGSVFERYNKVKGLESTPYKIDANPEISYDENLLKGEIQDFSSTASIEPQNAAMSLEGGSFKITPEQNGEEIDVDSTLSSVEDALAQGESASVTAVVKETPAEYTSDSFQDAQDLIGSYTTHYNLGSDDARDTNIANASSKLNGSNVYPGETFSTNAAFGEMSYANGYREAPVIVSGELTNDYGGGVCQVSTTLYDALLYAELDVTERQNHSKKVGYSPYGFDATLAGDYIDLKFVDDTDYPVYIQSYIGGGDITVNIYGHEIHDAGRSLDFNASLVETDPPPPEEIIDDPSLPAGERVVDVYPKDGYLYYLYKTVYENGVAVDTVQVNSSYYKPVQEVEKVGTGGGSSSNSNNSSTVAPTEKPTSKPTQNATPATKQPSQSSTVAPSTDANSEVTPTPEPTPATEEPAPTQNVEESSTPDSMQGESSSVPSEETSQLDNSAN